MLVCKQKSFPFDQNKIQHFSRLFNTDPLLMNFLFSKGLDEEENLSKFFFPNFDDLHSPFLFTDMKLALKRIVKAIKNKEIITIVSGYDVDGITSTSILYKAISFFGGNATYYIPNYQEGYGLNQKTFPFIKNRFQPSLILLVGNGSNNKEILTTAKEKGIDIIIIDHQEVNNQIPTCFAFLNPKRKDNDYPFSDLSCSGISFKVVQALFEISKYSWVKYAWEYLELASIGTLCDNVLLQGENRVISFLGLQKLNSNPIANLAEIRLQMNFPSFNNEGVTYYLSSLLSSPGKIDDPNLCVKILTSKIVLEKELKTLFAINERRKDWSDKLLLRAKSIVLKNNLDQYPILIVSGEFNDGLLGSVSARLSSEYKKPSIVINENGKGSARGTKQFPILECLKKCSSFLETFGGRDEFASFSLKQENVPSFSKAINKCAEGLPLSLPALEYDFLIKMEQFPSHIIDELELLGPFGTGNERPVFYSPYTFVKEIERFGKLENYVKFKHENFTATHFSSPSEDSSNNNHFDFIYYPQRKYRFFVEEYKKSGSL